MSERVEAVIAGMRWALDNTHLMHNMTEMMRAGFRARDEAGTWDAIELTEFGMGASIARDAIDEAEEREKGGTAG